MKKDIHPKSIPVVFIDDSSGAEFIAHSTLRSEEKKKINGVDYCVIKVETSSASHPFYTGNQKSANKGDQVAKFLAKMQKAQEANKPKEVKKPEAAEEKPVKKVAAKKSVKKAA